MEHAASTKCEGGKFSDVSKYRALFFVALIFCRKKFFLKIVNYSQPFYISKPDLTKKKKKIERE